jgi:hypothetical protein
MVIKDRSSVLKNNKGIQKCSQNKKRKTIFERESTFYE